MKTEEDVRHPNVHVALTTLNGNAFTLIGTVRAALRKARVPSQEIDEFTREASSGDYDHVLRTILRWVGTS